MNPVEARLVARADGRPWASTRALLAGQDNSLVQVAPARDRIGDVADFLAMLPDGEAEHRRLNAQGVGRPLMSEEAMAALESQLGRPVRKRRREPKPSRDKGEDRGQRSLGI